LGIDMAREVAARRRLTAGRLHDRYAEVYGRRQTGNRTLLVRRIAWRLQALFEGDSATTR